MRSIVTLIALAAVAQSASAQIYNPWGLGSRPNPWAYQTIRPGQTYNAEYVGRLPNGTPVINPWVRPTVYPVVPANYFNYSVNYNYSSLWNPSLFPAYGYNTFQNYGFNAQFNAGILPSDLSLPRVEQEVGRLLPVNREVAVNPVSGTILNARRGIALTREGAFYRVPGTGSISPWGTFVPGSGVYVNPFTGTRYEPSTGLIAR